MKRDGQHNRFVRSPWLVIVLLFMLMVANLLINVSSFALANMRDGCGLDFT